MSERDLDQLLVMRAQGGDLSAFDLLVGKYQHRILALAQRFVNFEDAKDVTQDAFIKAYKALPGFRGESAFFTWLYRIAVNTAKNHLQAKQRRPSELGANYDEVEILGLAQLKPVHSPESELERDQLEAVIMAAIKNLPENLRLAVTLREFDGLSYEEISEALDCPIGTVRSRIFRAREAIDLSIKAMVDPDETQSHSGSSER